MKYFTSLIQKIRDSLNPRIMLPQSTLTNKFDIEAWLMDMNITNYELLDNGYDQYVINVKGEVDLTRKGLTHIPVQFDRIEGAFYCDGNFLTSLQGAPNEVQGIFDCKNNKLTNLLGGPNLVTGYYCCARNELTTLFGSPEKCLSFYCANNRLTSLEYAPKSITATFDFAYNFITNWKYIPDFIGKQVIPEYYVNEKGDDVCLNYADLKDLQVINLAHAEKQMIESKLLKTSYKSKIPSAKMLNKI